MSEQEAFSYAINRYPLVYAAPTERDAKLKYWDHIFNTIGNGYRDTEEFVEKHSIEGIPKEKLKWLDNYPTKYISGAELYFLAGKEGETNTNLYTKEEIKLLPYSTKIVPAGCEGFKAPYPNFDKEYSLVWRVDLSKLDPSWILAAISYYEVMNMFFLSKDVHKYHDAPPRDKKELDKLISILKTGFDRYRTTNQTEEEFNAIITKEYGCVFTGDIEKYLTDKWTKEHLRIRDFILETLAMLRLLVSRWG